MPLSYKYINKDRVDAVLRRLNHRGYSVEEIFYSHGGMSCGKPMAQPISLNPHEQTQEWKLTKKVPAGWYTLTLEMDQDSSEQYSICTLQFNSHPQRTMLKEWENCRGPYPRFAIDDILWNNLSKIPQYEKILLAQSNLVGRLSKKLKLWKK